MDTLENIAPASANSAAAERSQTGADSAAEPTVGVVTAAIREPYVGPQPFEPNNSDIFFGRESEASEAFALVTAHRASLIYAQSGVGKTSLLNAGLLPLLSNAFFAVREKMLPRYDVLPSARVSYAMPGGSIPANVGNLYILNALMNLAGAKADCASLASLSLAGYLRGVRRPGEPTAEQAGNNGVAPPQEQVESCDLPRILIFDQFEELFTLHGERWRERRGFFLQVREALDGSLPYLSAFDFRDLPTLARALREQTNPMSWAIQPYLSDRTRSLLAHCDAAPRPPAELGELLADDLNDFLESGDWRDACSKIETLAARLAEWQKEVGLSREWLERRLLADAYSGLIAPPIAGDPLLHVVFSIREDFIGELDPYLALLPDKLRNRLRLEPLREQAALSAIQEPARKAGRPFAPGVAEALVRDLMTTHTTGPDDAEENITTEFVDTLQLQIVCQSLWNEARQTGAKQITIQKETGNVEQALIQFYEDGIRAVVAANVGVGERKLRDWFGQHLINSTGKRVPVFEGVGQTEGLSNQAIAVLVRHRLLRERILGGARCYELTHDRFVETVREANQQWLENYQADETRRAWLESRAGEWAGTRKPEYLLTAVETPRATEWIGSPNAKMLGVSDTLHLYIEQSRAQATHMARRQQRFLLGVAGLLTMTLAFAFWMTHLKGEADNDRTVALVRKKTAEKEAQAAVSKQNEAVSKQDEAVADSLLDLEQQRIASDDRARYAALLSIVQHNLANDPQVDVAAWAGAYAVASQPRLPFAPEQPPTPLNLARILPKPLLDRLQSPFLSAVVFSPDKQRIATATPHSVSVWDVRTQKRINYYQWSNTDDSERVLHTLAFGADGKTVAIAYGSRIKVLLNREDAKPFADVGGLTSTPAHIALVGDRSGFFAVVDEQGTVRLHPNASRGEWTMLDAIRTRITDLSIRPAGNRIAFGLEDGSFEIWRRDSTTGGANPGALAWKQLGDPIPAHDGPVTTLKYSAHGSYIATAGFDGYTKVWNGETGAEVKTRKHPAPMRTMAFSADEKSLITVTFDDVIHAWQFLSDMEYGRRKVTFTDASGSPAGS